ncbi:glycosyltransferase family 2 protein [Paenimyroides tangerinum]|uniref:Glycosyltransferase family 2 protein n=1 Tax=Paenimyroides tangerinum TaxID=2488728 RepID=A0A3P3WEY7_9FLAO|nr:glycosyltransferase family 2 protein [Paenimyroides tangerinum]RRJ93234.1 glycosyltransferase family 2 protein [Paenimyroides tangerinum]
MPFFSIIIPLFNKEKFLKATLESVFEQTFSDFEILVINDGSTDKSLEVVESIQHKKIKIYNQKNQGVSAARNLGIEKSTSDYCCFLDADDIWKPNHLESLFQLIQKFPDAGLYCNRYEIQISKNKIISTTFEFGNSHEGYINDFFKSSLVNRIALTSACCISKKTYHEIQGFDTEITNGEDLDYWIRIALKYKIAISNQNTLIYNFRTDNQSISKINIEKQKLPNLEKYHSEEKQNPSLKRFLDLYRIEYALHFHICGNTNKKKFYLKNVAKENINPKTKLLFRTPSILLEKMLFTKRYLKQFGIDFSVYH